MWFKGKREGHTWTGIEQKTSPEGDPEYKVQRAETRSESEGPT